MPSLQVRKPNEVPAQIRSSKAVQEQQRLYEGFVQRIGQNVGELVLSTGEQIRSVKTRLRRAGSRLGSQLEIWDADGKVYFKRAIAARRGRTKKAS